MSTAYRDIDSEYVSKLVGVLAVVDEASDKALAMLAARIDGRAKINIQQNGQIDTGFMLNSVYMVNRAGPLPPGGDAYAPGDARMAPPVSLRSGDSAAVVVGANYAIYQEAKNSFLFRAAEQSAPESGAVIVPIFEEALSD